MLTFWPLLYIIRTFTLYVRFEEDKDQLHISTVESMDEGLYICYISENENGNDAMALVGGCLIIYGQLINIKIL